MTPEDAALRERLNHYVSERRRIDHALRERTRQLQRWHPAGDVAAFERDFACGWFGEHPVCDQVQNLYPTMAFFQKGIARKR